MGGVRLSPSQPVLFSLAAWARWGRKVNQTACVPQALDVTAQHAGVEGGQPASAVGERLPKPGEGTWMVPW